MRITETTMADTAPNIRTFLLSDGFSGTEILVATLVDKGFPVDPPGELLPAPGKPSNRDVATDLALLASALLPIIGHTLPSKP